MTALLLPLTDAGVAMQFVTLVMPPSPGEQAYAGHTPLDHHHADDHPEHPASQGIQAVGDPATDPRAVFGPPIQPPVALECSKPQLGSTVR